MGVGRNLSYTRSMFLGQNNLSQYMHIACGDDDLLIQNALSSYKVHLRLHPKAWTFSQAKSDIAQMKGQMRRHMSAAIFYPFLPKFLLGLWALHLFCTGWGFVWFPSFSFS